MNREDLNFLMSEFSGDIWAKEFVKLNSASDVGIMRAWFCCAIMAGYDHAKREEETTESKEEDLNG